MILKEKAKRYDEVIERANSLLSSNQLGNAWIYKLLPELKKSEDERIKKPIEPKFHEGDWIITNKKHVWYVDETPETTSYLYRLINQYGKVEVAEFEVVDEKARLWTIEDAKDGDVLVSTWKGCSYIYIFKEVENNIIMSHVFYYPKLDTIDMGVINMNNTPTIPATKEQRDILFAKIKEARYEWDAEHKQLKKIKQKPEHPYCQEHCKGYKESGGKCYFGFNCEAKREAEKNPTWSEKDEEMLEDVRSNFEFNREKMSDGLIEQYNHFFDKIKYLQSQLQQEWSEEDESMLNFVKVVLSKHQNDEFFDKSETTLNDCLSWFKDIKSRVGCEADCTTTKEWSEEDIVAIDCAVEVLSKDLPSLAASIERLKSLRLQKRWKPTRTQTDSLGAVIKHPDRMTEYNKKELTELLEQLKKLK